MNKKAAWLLVALALLGACRPTPTPTVIPTATPVPITARAYQVALDFLAAWQEGDYQAMYDLCSTSSRSATPFAEFQRIYAEVAAEATILSVQPRLGAVLETGTQAQATFSATFETSFVGSFETENDLSLVWERGQWAVEWSKTCIFRELTPENYVFLDSKAPVRANIYDANGKGLAVEGSRVTVGIVPGQIRDEPSVLARLSLVLNMPQTEIAAKYQDQPPNWFIPIADISVETSRQHYELLSEEPGISVREKLVREYRDPIAAPHLIGYTARIPAENLDLWQERGYVGDELVGRTGIEAWGEPYLAGQRGGVLTIVTPQGQVAVTLARRELVPARSIYLTFEQEFQLQVENLLGERKGAIVVMDVNNGHVLAMATWPRFDLHHFAEGIDPQAWSALVNNPDNPLVNRAIQGLYPPGSTFKIITMGTILERGGVSPTQTYTCPGSWNKLGWPMTCWLTSGHGTISLVNALTASCDVTFYQIGYDLSFVDMDALPSYSRAFGLGAPTGLGQGIDDWWGEWDPLGEQGGLIPDDAWKRDVLGEGFSTGDTVNMAIGQGFVLATPLQMARMVAAVANGGTLYRPMIVQRIGATGKEPEMVIEPERVGRLPITDPSLVAIQRGLQGVTTLSIGTATHRFEGFPIPVAGKTGTSQNEGELPHAWFVGYLPANKPEIAIAVIVENVGEGSTFAAPLFRQVAEAYYDIAPETDPAATATPSPE